MAITAQLTAATDFWILSSLNLTPQRKIFSGLLCYMGALELAASKKHIKLPPEVAVDAEINLNGEGGNFFLASKLNVSLPGVDREVAEALIQDAHGICPYSKAVRGNIAVETKLV